MITGPPPKFHALRDILHLWTLPWSRMEGLRLTGVDGALVGWRHVCTRRLLSVGPRAAWALCCGQAAVIELTATGVEARKEIHRCGF
jgi:hypothetical protein